MNAEQALRGGDLDATLKQLQQQVRKEPAVAKHRIFLFQLLAVLGQWSKALNQLNVLKDMDDSALAMVQTYTPALQCEALRTAVFAGKRTPLIFGEPEPWLAPLLEALRHDAANDAQQAQDLRGQALDGAPTSPGSIDGASFAWLMDADARLGPVLEAIVNGRYYWIPFARIQRIDLEEPNDLRDLVWLPAHFTWANGGQTVGLIPSRYPGSESHGDDAVQLARKTVWEPADSEHQYGLGQRLLASDQADYPLLDTRAIEFQQPEPAAAEPEHG